MLIDHQDLNRSSLQKPAERLVKIKTVIAIALILIYAMAVLLVALPIATADDPPWKVTIYPFFAVSPDPIGVSQQGLIYFWMSILPPTATRVLGDHWENLKVEVTKAGGSKVTLGERNWQIL